MTNTATLRAAARKYESDCQWGLAAKLYRSALAAYPSTNRRSALYASDIAALERRAASCEQMARLERERDEHARRDAHSEAE